MPIETDDNGVHQNEYAPEYNIIKECKPYTQRDVAKKAGVSAAFVNNVIQGKRNSTRVSKLVKEMLGITVKCKPTMRDRIKELESLVEILIPSVYEAQGMGHEAAKDAADDYLKEKGIK
jgi:transcriptional regulator with XRE-family HTH domain